jgi:hypothetical protein
MTEADIARLFTLEEAQRLLPVIEPDVAEMKRLFSQVRREIKNASEETGIPAASDRLAKHLETRGIAPALVGRINDLIRRIHGHGCIVNGPEAGLIDFPALLDSEIVFLCWKHGERRIGHWHRIPDGFAGRKPLLDRAGSPDAGASVH